VVAILSGPEPGATEFQKAAKESTPHNECAVYTEILNNEDLAELKLAFDMACNELRLGMSAKDVVRREHLAKLMLELVQAGERDPIMIRIQAVHKMRQLK